MSGLKPLVKKLEGKEKYRRLLGGEPETAGFRSGCVNLEPGQDIGEHSTEGKEEALVILSGRGEISYKGEPAFIVEANSLVYIPPQTAHNVKNTGNEILKYVYIVAPVK